MWLAGHNCLQLSSLVRHLMIQEGVKAFNCPGHGTSFGKATQFPKGTFKARTSKRIFSQFSVFRPACAESGVDRPEGHTVARIRERQTQRFVIAKGFVIPNRAESPVRNLLLGLAALLLPLPKVLPACGKRLEILWDVSIDRILRRTYVCKVSRTVGFALVRDRLD